MSGFGITLTNIHIKKAMQTLWRMAARLVVRPMVQLGLLFVVGVMGGLLIGLGTGVPTQVSWASPVIDIEYDREVPVFAEETSPAFNVPPTRLGRDRPRPKIAIVIDDLGLSQSAFDRVNVLPVPLTLSFLPYGEEAQGMVDRVAPNHEIMLHLPMEPLEKVTLAGPDYLRADQSPKQIKSDLRLNLSKLSGYVGVNNHTGSAFTSDADAMHLVLDELDMRGLFFLDSLTTLSPVAAELAVTEGWRVLERDVFLDADEPAVTAGTVKARLQELEHIASVTGEAIGIGHPYPVTLDVLGPWLVTAEARGFDIVPVSRLLPDRLPRSLAQLR